MKFTQVAFAQVAIKVYEVFDTNVSLAATMISVTGKKAPGIGERGRGQGGHGPNFPVFDKKGGSTKRSNYLKSTVLPPT